MKNEILPGVDVTGPVSAEVSRIPTTEALAFVAELAQRHGLRTAR